MIPGVLKVLFHLSFVRPFVVFYLGLRKRSVIEWDKALPSRGPAIIIANHNSNADTPIIESLFPLHFVGKVRPVAAKDYWAKTKLLDWFARNVMRVIYVERGSGQSGKDPYGEVHAALARGEIIILYPEGKRGKPEEPTEIKKGITYLMQQHPLVPVIPIHLYGAGKAFGTADRWWKHIPVPFIVDVLVGENLSPRDPQVPADPDSIQAAVARIIYHQAVCNRFAELKSANCRGAWV